MDNYKDKKQIDIFIVDDNKVFGIALKGAIEVAFADREIKIHAFETGECCMKCFTQVLPELVILDYHLNSNSPDAANGLEVLDRIKSNYKETSVIMLTSNDQIDIALKSFNHGASDYVVKTGNQFKKINDSIAQIFAKKELAFQKEKKEKEVLELIIADKELEFQDEKEKRVAELHTITLERAEVEKYKLIIEEKNKDITDSIIYAKRIQQAKLPKKEDIYAALPDSFVLYKPKAIVSGDFYFFHKTGQRIFIAAADCTGHGVPGAFLSMIGSEKLEEAVSASTDTSDILKRLNKGIKASLRQSESYDSTHDGMDIALCVVNTTNYTVKYAGANRPLWIIRNGQAVVEEIKATKRAIGGYTLDEQHFDTHQVQLAKGDSFYIFSDGYADNFGGSAGKKLMTKRFKEILLSIQHMPMLKQEEYLEGFIETWKNGEEQVDDILVIGVRL
jgi:serine phosphatase RsbU (regulator of sigma subunit)